jgi:nucleoside-diphosphate-sugar epimerase
VNIYGTALLIEMARDHKVRRFIFSSSSSVYGGAKIMPTKESENPPKPISPYAIQKYTGEMLLKAASDLSHMETISLRYFNVYGPGQYGDSPYSTAVAAWLEGLYFPPTDPKRAPFLEGDGTQTRDLCYVENVVAANICAMKAAGPLYGETVNIAHGERTSLNEIHDFIEEYTGRTLNLERRPPRLGDVKDTHADITFARELIGYEPVVKFKEGLQRTVAWFEERGKSGK